MCVFICSLQVAASASVDDQDESDVEEALAAGGQQQESHKTKKKSVAEQERAAREKDLVRLHLVVDDCFDVSVEKAAHDAGSDPCNA